MAITKDMYLQMDNQSSAIPEQQSKLEKEWACKHAKRARKSAAEKDRRKSDNRKQNMLQRVSESKAEHARRLAAGQQRDANCRASESKVLVSSELLIVEL